MFASSLSKPVLIILACLALAGCKSDAERADEYFQSGMELLQSGDESRAMVQFRNVFEFDPSHLESRQVMAEHFMDQGNLRAALGQYLAIAEQYPDNFEARRALAELAFVVHDWPAFERHGAAAVAAQPEDPRVKAIDLGQKYRTAALDDDNPTRQALVAPAEALLLELPENKILNNLLIDSYGRDGAIEKALARIDVLLETEPDNRQLYTQRLGLLGQLQDMPMIEAQLRTMVEQFPGDTEFYATLLRFYVSQERMDDAEAFLREISSPADEDPALFLSLIQFVGQTKGEEAARVEIERAIAENPAPNRFKAMLAMMDFQTGQQDQAIAAMETILSDADILDSDTQNIQVALARMLVGTGNQVGARRLVEEVLAQNPANVDALKMQASWRLQADEVDEAIADLRVALDTAPEDIQVLNLMAEAHTRLGDANLARDYLAQAVEVSGAAPEPSLRYARVLFNEERYLPAEDVILPALQQNPRNVDLLGLLGQIYLRLDDGSRATQVVDTLGRIDTDQARALANALQVDLLSRQSGNEEALTFLENLASSGDAGLREQVILLRARLQVGETEAALSIAEKLVAENPDNLGLKLALSSTQAANGDLAVAEATLLELTAAAPQAPQPWLQRMRLARVQGEADRSDALIDEALDATNRHPNILLAKAAVLERAGDIDGAIAIYEDLYAQNSNSVIIANNLASMLATYRDDAESLERAWVVGRRLQGADNPALQDTYGWLLYRRGEFGAALPYLESSAEALDDPLIEAHLGFAYAALERNEEALAQLQKAVDLAGPADTRERIEAARAEITRLRSLPEN